MHIRISLGAKFKLKLPIFIFLAKFAQKGYFQLKTEKLILQIQISLATKFLLKLTILIF